MPSITELGQRVKSKYPGAYDDMPDDEIGRSVKAKFPGQYDDFADEATVPGAPAPQMLPSHAQLKTPRQAVAGEEAPGLGRGIARGGWALPGLVGLDYETAAAAEWAVRDPDKLGERGLGLRERFNYYQEKERERSRRGEAEHPIRTGLGIGIGATPSMLVMPQAKAAQGAGLGARAMASALTSGAQSAAIEGGVTGGLPAEERLKRMAVAGAAGGTIGALAPMPSHAIDTEAAPSSMADYLRQKGGERNIKAAGGIQSDIARARKQIGRERLTNIGAEFSEEGLTGPFSTPAKTYERALALQDQAGKEMGGILRQADKDPAAATKVSDLVGRVRSEVLVPLQENPHTSSAPNIGHAGMGGGTAADQMTGLLEKYLAIYGKKPLTPSVLHEIRQNISQDLYGLRGNKDPWASAYKDALHQFRSIVSDEINQSIDRAGLSTQPWAAANRTYEIAARAEEFADKGMDRAHGNNWISPMETLAGLAGAGMGVSHGGPGLTMGALALGGGTALARRHGSGMAGAAMVKLSNALKTNPEQFGANASALLGAAERGPEALAAAHYVLSLRSPEYRLRWNAAAQHEEHE